jgi:hypothetical protein
MSTEYTQAAGMGLGDDQSRDNILTAVERAETSETNAATSETNAANSATASATSATEASNSASNAATSETNAATSATEAATNATTATNQANSASTSATNAATAATNAATSSTNAATSETNAATSATNAANSASNAAASAATASSEATTATNAAVAAEAAELAASNHATEAEGYSLDALAYRNESDTSATNAATSETNAAASATAASNSAGVAGLNATSSADSAGSAANSATAAANSATASAASATQAATSATSAAQSAASAATLLDNFDDKYLGAKASNPSVDNDGNPLVSGSLYFNSTDNEMRVYDGSMWISASSAGIQTMDKFRYTASSSQTVFTGADDGSDVMALNVGAEIVTLNGVVLEQGTDYTATTNTITLTAGASAGDELNVFAFGNFTVADTVSASAGGTFQNNVTVNGTVTAGNITDNSGNTYQKDNILGVVSQSGGVPTGAIIERGSNANGEFVKYADGTLICTYKGVYVDSSGATLSNIAGYHKSVSYGFPAVFAAAPHAVTPINKSSVDYYTIATQDSTPTTTLTGVLYALFPNNNGSVGTHIGYIAIGRWY